MTTEETLAFFAALILPAHMGSADKAARVKEVLAALGLSHTAHTLVGAAAAACWSAKHACKGAWVPGSCSYVLDAWANRCSKSAGGHCMRQGPLSTRAPRSSCVASIVLQ